MWLRGCVERCRGGYCFRACVARDPETPLTKLHVMQPVLGAAAAPLTLCCVALLLLTVPVAVLTLLEGAELHTLELLCADLALTLPSLPAGAPRTYHVRWPDCARSAYEVPTHELRTSSSTSISRGASTASKGTPPMQPREGRHGGRRPAEQFEGTTLDPK